MASILVVDDELVIRDGCSRLLVSEGHAVLCAANGLEALDLLAREAVDIILCDLKMPVMGAIELLDEARAHYPDVPLIVITGHGTVTNAVECMRKGAYDFITKPFRADHLLLLVERALQNQALERRNKILQEEHVRNLYDLSMEQSRIRTILDCMEDGILITNRDMEVVLHNPALMRLFELPSTLPQPGAFSDYVPVEGLSEALRALQERAETEAGFISREISRGNTHLRALSAPIYGLRNAVLGSVTVFHDISTFKALDEMKSNFVHMVSHELRSPMATINQQIGVILEGLAGDLTEKQRELLTRAKGKILNLLHLINDLLDIARIESGRQDVERQEPLRIDEVLRDTVSFMKGRAESQKIELLLDVPAELPLIYADPRRMEEVFHNLIGNAINYSPDGGVVTVSVRPHGDYLEIKVSDTGIGIAGEEIAKIFDKFYRVKHPRTRQVIGTGLGLAIVKGIIESHRGSIEVESEPEVGATFRILLPTIVGE
jgi:signal transduction histidine kinase